MLCLLSIVVFNFFLIDYNNNRKSSDLITKKYSATDIQALENAIYHSNKIGNYYELKWNYNIQCLRKTPQGYYAILLQEDEKRVFVFMNDNLEIEELLIADQTFKSKNDFEKIVKNQSVPFFELDDFDINYFPSRSSIYYANAHIVKEGGVYIIVDGIAGMNQDNIITDGYYIDFDEILISDDHFINSSVWIILDIDCMNS